MMFQRSLRIIVPALLLISGIPPAYGQAARPADNADKTDKIARADAAYKRAQAAFESGDFDKAIQLFDEVVRLDPKYVEAYVSRGMAWNEKSEPDKAIRDFNEAIK